MKEDHEMARALRACVTASNGVDLRDGSLLTEAADLIERQAKALSLAAPELESGVRTMLSSYTTSGDVEEIENRRDYADTVRMIAAAVTVRAALVKG